MEESILYVVLFFIVYFLSVWQLEIQLSKRELEISLTGLNMHIFYVCPKPQHGFPSV